MFPIGNQTTKSKLSTEFLQIIYLLWKSSQGEPISYMDKYAAQVEENMKMCFPNGLSKFLK